MPWSSVCSFGRCLESIYGTMCKIKSKICIGMRICTSLLCPAVAIDETGRRGRRAQINDITTVNVAVSLRHRHYQGTGIVYTSPNPNGISIRTLWYMGQCKDHKIHTDGDLLKRYFWTCPTHWSEVDCTALLARGYVSGSYRLVQASSTPCPPRTSLPTVQWVFKVRHYGIGCNTCAFM